MKQKIILFDMDGVLCQYDEKLLRLAHERLGLPLYYPHEVTSFNTELLFPEEYRERVEALANEEGFFSDLLPFPGAVEAFKKIAADPRFIVFICTSPKRFYKNRSCVKEKNIWVSTFLGKEWTDKVIFVRDKTCVRGDMLIDDKPEIEGVQTPSWIHVYHDRPYNKNSNRPRITSWENWEEVLVPVLYP